jgi:hypothetical protein
MNAGLNPYLNRTAIRNDADFFGRRRELTTILSRIDHSQPQSVSVVGERRSGKSSLLRAIPRQAADSLRRPDQFVFVFLNLSAMPQVDVGQFFGALLEQVALACQDPRISEQAPSYESVRKLVESLERNRQRLVLLMDGFETVTRNPNFTLDFYSFLRSVPNNYAVSFIVSSARELQELCHSKEIAGSPFFNIFHKLNLGYFPHDEALELICKPSEAAGYPLEPHTAEILRMAGCFPLFLQMACSAFFEYHLAHPDRKSPDLKVIAHTFAEESQSHLQDVWKSLSDRERELCQKIVMNSDLNEPERRVRENLIRRGYVLRDDSGTRLFSEPFEDHVKAAWLSSHAEAIAHARPAAERHRGEAQEPRTERQQSAAKSLPLVCIGLADSRPHQVFLSYSSRDRQVADLVYFTLKRQKFNCWMAPHDIVGGLDFDEQLMDAIDSSQSVVLILSANSNTSKHVKIEAHRALDNRVPIIPLRIEEVRPGKSLAYALQCVHWVDAFPPPIQSHIGSLVEHLRSVLGRRVSCPPRGDEALGGENLRTDAKTGRDTPSIRRIEELFGPIRTRHGGELLRQTHDLMIASFIRYRDAVDAAIAFQKELTALEGGSDRISGRARVAVTVGEVSLTEAGTYRVVSDADQMLEKAKSHQVLVSSPVYASLDPTTKALFSDSGLAGGTGDSMQTYRYVEVPDRES